MPYTRPSELLGLEEGEPVRTRRRPIYSPKAERSRPKIEDAFPKDAASRIKYIAARAYQEQQRKVRAEVARDPLAQGELEGMQGGELPSDFDAREVLKKSAIRAMPKKAQRFIEANEEPNIFEKATAKATAPIGGPYKTVRDFALEGASKAGAIYASGLQPTAAPGVNTPRVAPEDTTLGRIGSRVTRGAANIAIPSSPLDIATELAFSPVGGAAARGATRGLKQAAPAVRRGITNVEPAIRKLAKSELGAVGGETGDQAQKRATSWLRDEPVPDDVARLAFGDDVQAAPAETAARARGEQLNADLEQERQTLLGIPDAELRRKVQQNRVEAGRWQDQLDALEEVARLGGNPPSPELRRAAGLSGGPIMDIGYQVQAKRQQLQNTLRRAQDMGDELSRRGTAPLSDFEKQMQAGIAGKRIPNPTKTVTEMKAELAAAGLPSTGTPSQVTSRYRGFQASQAGGIATPNVNTSQVARETYQQALERTGDPEAARLAARKAAAQEAQANRKASRLGRLMDELNSEEGSVRIPGRAPQSPQQPGLEGIPQPPRQNASFSENFYDELIGFAGAPLALRTTISPARGRQGLIRFFTNPKAALQSTGRSMRAAVRESDSRLFQQTLLDQPEISRYSSRGRRSEFGGYTADEVDLKVRDWGVNAPPEKRATDFQGLNKSRTSRAIQKLPHVRFSDRQYAMEFNADVTGKYAEVARGMDKAGIHDKRFYDDAARVIEHQQQFGPWKQGKIPLFFSVPAMSGRVEAIRDLYRYGSLPAAIRRPGAAREAWKGATAMVGANMAWMGLASTLPGFDIEFQGGVMPILKTPVGRINPWAGWATIATLVYDNATLIQEAVEAGGDIDELLPQVTERVARFLRGQSSPLASKAADIGTGKDYRGQPYSFSKDITGGNLLADLTAPMLAESIIEGYKDHGIAGAVASGGIEGISGSLNTDVYTKDARASVTAELFPGKKYDDLLESQKRQVDADPSVIEAKGQFGPTEYAQNRDRRKAEAQEKIERVQQAWQAGQLSQTLPTLLSDIKAARYQSLEDLRKDNAEAFSKLPDSKHQSTLDGYFAIEHKFADGEMDWDKTIPEREAYIASLKPEERSWFEDYTGVKQSEKTQVERDLDAYNDKRDSLGYFVKDADRDALDRANPDIDVQSWLYYGGLIDKDENPDPVLQSVEAVEKALSMGLPNRNIKLDGMERPINQDEKSLAGWKYSKTPVNWYLKDMLDENGDREAQRLYRSTGNKLYNKPFSEIKGSERSAIVTNLHEAARKDPELEAWLYWWGVIDKPAARTIPYIEQIFEQYGNKPPK